MSQNSGKLFGPIGAASDLRWRYALGGGFGWFALIYLFVHQLAWIRIQYGDAGVVVLILPALLCLPGGLWYAERRLRLPALQCPHCGTFLANGHHVVIASRNCFECGQQVLSADADRIRDATSNEEDACVKINGSCESLTHHHCVLWVHGGGRF